MTNKPRIMSTIANHRVLDGPRLATVNASHDARMAPKLASARWLVLAAIISLMFWAVVLKFLF